MGWKQASLQVHRGLGCLEYLVWSGSAFRSVPQVEENYHAVSSSSEGDHSELSFQNRLLLPRRTSLRLTRSDVGLHRTPQSETAHYAHLTSLSSSDPIRHRETRHCYSFVTHNCAELRKLDRLCIENTMATVGPRKRACPNESVRCRSAYGKQTSSLATEYGSLRQLHHIHIFESTAHPQVYDHRKGYYLDRGGTFLSSFRRYTFTNVMEEDQKIEIEGEKTDNTGLAHGF
ncbi:hypothetical protein VTO42DRAFT_4577 [Malbranchea cinnamomea]